MKKLITLLLLVGLCVGLLLYNGTLPKPESDGTEPVTESTETSEAGATTPPPAGQVRILNNDPSRQAAWESVAAAYTGQTGVPVTVISDSGQATLFTLSSVEELADVQDRCLDLSGTEAYAQLASWDLTLQADGKVCGIAAGIEAFGLVCNASLLARAGYTQKDITGFSGLKAVVESITANSGELGFSAFARVDPSKNFPIQLACLGGETRDFLDLFINNATCAPTEMSSCTELDALEDFLGGKAVFYLAKTGKYEDLAALGSENLSIMPVYLGGENEERQSLCAVASSYWCVRGDVLEPDIQATVKFLDYLVKPGSDGTVPVDQLGLLAPYRQAAGASNALESFFRNDLAAGKELLVCKNVSQVPDGIAEALILYAADPTDENWTAVTSILER